MKRDEFETAWATRHLRMLLINAGLGEDDVDAFLAALHREFEANGLVSDEEWRLLCHQQISELLSRMPSVKARRIEDLIIGVASISLWEMLSSVYRAVRTDPPPPARKLPPAEWADKQLDRVDTAWFIEEPGFPMTQADYMAVERLVRRALEVRVEAYGSMDPHTNQSRTALAFLLCWHGRIMEAETLFRQVLQVTERAFGPKHHYTGAALSNLGGNLTLQRRYLEAEPLLRRGAEIEAGKPTQESPETAGAALFNLGLNLTLQGKNAKAGALFRRSLDIAEKNLRPGDYRIAAIRACLRKTERAGRRTGTARITRPR